MNDAAKQLGVDPTKLSDALKQALANRVDAAVKAGTLTQAQGTELKARIQADAFPLFGGRGLGPGGHRGGGFGHPSRRRGELSRSDAAVAARRLTTAQRDERVSGLKERVTALVNGERPAGAHGLRGRHSFEGPPRAA